MIQGKFVSKLRYFGCGLNLIFLAHKSAKFRHAKLNSS